MAAIKKIQLISVYANCGPHKYTRKSFKNNHLYLVFVFWLIENMASITSLLFGLEIFHVITHTLVMTGYRTLPRKILSRQKYYFLVDLLTSLGSFLIHGRFWQIIFLQNIQHAFYILTWPDSR